MSARFPGPILLPVMAAGFLAGACQAGEPPMQNSPSSAVAGLPVDEVIGFWRVASASGPESCLIALNSLAAGDGYGVHIETCSLRAFTAAHDWRPVPGGFELRDSAGAAIARFRKTAAEAYASVEGGYRMEPAAVS